MPELSTLLLTVAATAMASLAAFLLWRHARRRREARDIERAYVERHPLALTAAEIDRALDSPPQPESETPPPRSSGSRPLALGGVTVAAAVATLLLVVRPNGAPTPDESGDSDPAISGTVLTRLPVERQPAPNPAPPAAPRSSSDPTTTDTTRHTTPPSPSASTSNPEPSTTSRTTTSSDPPDTPPTTTATSTITTDPTDGASGDESEPSQPGTHPGRDSPDSEQPDSDRLERERPDHEPRQSLVLSLVGAVVELIDPRS